MKVKTFEDERLKSDSSSPPSEIVKDSSSTSLAEMLVTAVWFSSTLYVESKLSNVGTSFTELITIEMLLEEVLLPWVMLYEMLSVPKKLSSGTYVTILSWRYAVPSVGKPMSTIIGEVIRYESLLRTFISIETSSSVITESSIAVISGCKSSAFTFWSLAI